MTDDVKMNHAPQQRREAKHEVRQRQLPRLFAVTLAGLLLLRPFPAKTSGTAPREELQAAKMMETALFARQAGAEEWKKLERAYADLVAKYPADAAVRNAQGEFLWTIGEQGLAMESWLAAEKLEPGNAVVLDHLGDSYLAEGNAQKAAAFYRRAATSSPANAAYHFSYANVAFLFRHQLLDADHADADSLLRDALAHFAEAARLQPLDAEYARAYAETFYSVPDPDWRAALRAWQHFHEISPRKDFALLNLARVHMKLGNKPEAREILARIQSPEFNRLKARLQERIETE